MEKYITTKEQDCSMNSQVIIICSPEKMNRRIICPNISRADSNEFPFLIFLKRNLKVLQTFGRYNNIIK